MEVKENMFEKESIGRLLARLAIPIILSMLVSELYNMVDTYFVGNYVSDPNGIGALVVVFPIQRIIIALSMMIGIGTSTAFSRARGANDYEDARTIVKTGFTLVAAIMIPLTIVVSIFAVPILKVLGASGTLLSFGYEYLSIIILGSLFLSWTTFTSNIMISLGKSTISIASTSVGAILNLIIDTILVKNLGMGVRGAAIATTASQIAGFLFSYYHLHQFKKEYGVSFGFNLSPIAVTSILTVGVSSFIVEAEDGILIAVLNNLLSTSVGAQAINVLGVTSKVYMFLFVTLFGISNAMQPIAAYSVGAENYQRLGLSLKKTVIYATMTTGILWFFSMLFTPELMAIFVNDPGIIKEATMAFRIMIAVFPLISVYYISIFYYQALGKAKTSILVSILRQIVIMIPLAIYLVIGRDMGAMGVWLSYPIADIIVFLISSILLIRESGKIKKLL